MLNINHYTLATFARESYHRATVCIGEVEVWVQYINGTQVVTYRGTEGGDLFRGRGWRDVWRDARIIPAHDDRVGWGHAGFLHGALGVVDGFLREHLTSTKPVVCTGHSMGGALALITACALKHHGYAVQEWVGFAAPGALMGAREWGDIALTNYKNGNDAVVDNFPLGALYDQPCDLTAVGRAQRWWPNYVDHDISRYVDALTPRHHHG